MQVKYYCLRHMIHASWSAFSMHSGVILLFVWTAGFGHLGGHIVLAGWPAFGPCQQPPSPLFPEYMYSTPSTMPSFTLKGVSGRYIGGSGKWIRLRWILSCSMSLLANFGGVKEVHVLWMREPLVSRNKGWDRRPASASESVAMQLAYSPQLRTA